jgi:mono/diheme cytochrome c family protein/uncharacterized cupredoxin-like copper-binding protein
VNNSGRLRSRQLRGAIVVAACAAVALPMAASTATSATVKVTLGKPRETAFKITPAKVPAGTVSFQVTNAGKLPHAFQVCTSPLGGTANRCTGPKTARLTPGKTAKLTAKLGIGKHEYLDPLTGNAASGMKGTLVVIAATTPVGTTTTPANGGTTSVGSSPGAGAGPSSGGGGSPAGGGAAGNLVGDPVAGAVVFANAGCTTCHTLKAANSAGGIDLDAFAPDQATVIDNVSNGNSSGMPDFSLQLTKAQINNVASYVFCVTHGHTPQNC